jgi:lysophospholipase L1-like esterase
MLASWSFGMDLKRYTIPAIGMLVLAGVVLIRSLPPSPARPTAGHQVIAFGDSLIAGYGSTAGHDVVTELTDRVGVTIVNAGRNGDTTESALARLDRDVLSHDPRVVIVLLGGNDFLRKVPRDRTFANLGTIVDRIRAKGAGVVLVGINPGLIGDPFDSAFEELALRTESALVPDVLNGILGNGELMSDAIHPNDRGYAMMAERIQEAVRAMVR